MLAKCMLILLGANADEMAHCKLQFLNNLKDRLLHCFIDHLKIWYFTLSHNTFISKIISFTCLIWVHLVAAETVLVFCNGKMA